MLRSPPHTPPPPPRQLFWSEIFRFTPKISGAATMLYKTTTHLKQPVLSLVGRFNISWNQRLTHHWVKIPEVVLENQFLKIWLLQICKILMLFSNIQHKLHPLSSNFRKWSKTFKHLVSTLLTNCLSVFRYFVGWCLKS